MHRPVRTGRSEDQPSPRTLHYTVDFIEADGRLADRVLGTGACGSFMSVPGRLLQPGSGAVVVRCVSDQGCSVGARKQVQVQPCGSAQPP